MKKTNIFTVLVLFCSLFGFLSCTKHYADGDGGIKPSDDPVFIYDKEIIAGGPFFLSVSEVIENPIVRFDGTQMSLSVDESASQNGKSNIYISVPEDYRGDYSFTLTGRRGNSAADTTFNLGTVTVFEMVASENLRAGRPHFADLDDAVLLVEAFDSQKGREESFGMKLTKGTGLDSLKCTDGGHEELPTATLRAFKTISAYYSFAWLHYATRIDTIYSRSDGFVARQQLVKDAYPVLVRSSDGFLIPLNESAGNIFGEDEHAVQFRCESENTFFFMPSKESPDGVAGVPIYRFDIDRALLDNSSTEGLNEDGYLELARLGVKVTKVFDGSTTVAVADKYSPIRWCVSGNNVLLNENEILVDGVVRQIERVAGQSDSFIGTPAIVVAPDGDFMAIINTSSGLYVHRLVKNGETWSWQIDSPELDLGGHWNITEAFVEGDATLVGNGRYYKWNTLGELVSSDFYYFNELYFPCDNYYPHNEHYVYSTRYDDVLQRAKPESLGVRESIYFSVGGKIVDFSVMNDVVVVSVEGNRFCIVENGEQGDIFGSDKYEITEYTARIK